MRKRVRIIIDTNLWIRFLISKRYQFLEDLIVSQRVMLLFSDELISEMVKVVQRPKMQKYFDKDSLRDMLKLIDSISEYIYVSSTVALCRDKKDNFLINLALDGKADYILSDDEDLLELNPFGTTKIIGIGGFKQIFEKKTNKQ